MGCAAKSCYGGTSGGEGDAPGWFVTCEYWPRGNVIGQFADNVQASAKGEENAGSRIGGGGWGVLAVAVVMGVAGVL
jgi:hypothetical protein